MTAPSNEILSEKIDNLSRAVEVGFEGMHERQDKTNGNVVKNSEHRLKMESALGVYRWLFGFLGIGNIAVIIKLFL